MAQSAPVLNKTAVATNSYTITVPSTAAVGDYMVIFASFANGSDVINYGTTNAPTGWTPLFNASGGTIPAMSWGKRCVSADLGASVTVAQTGPAMTVQLSTWSNVGADTIATQDAVGSWTSGTAIPNQPPTTADANCVIVDCWFIGDGGSPTYSAESSTDTATQPFCNYLDTGTGNNWGLFVGYHDQATAGGGASESFTVTASSSGSYTFIGLALPPIQAPSAPTLTAPANASYEDLSGTPTFTWTYNPTQSDGPQGAFAFRQKISGGSYSYWNASSSAWQSTIVWNSYTTTSYTFPAGAWADGNIYNWSVATQENIEDLQGVFASDLTVTAQAPPGVTITAPTGTVATVAPTVTATVSPASGATVTAYRVIVYTAAQVAAGGFTPGTTVGVYDSGTVASTSTSVSQATSGLSNNVTYYAYVQATETGGETGAWASQAFTVSFDPPAQPTITAVAGTDPTTGLPTVTLTVQGHDNVLSATDASFGGGVGSWTSWPGMTISDSNAYALDGSASLALVPTQGINVPQAVTMSTTATGTTGYPVVGGASYVLIGAYMAGGTSRGTQVGVSFYDSAGTFIETVAAPVISDASSYWSFDVDTVTAPSNAAFAAIDGFVYSPNMLTADDASFEGGIGSWVAGTNCTLAQSTAEALFGTHSLAVSSAASGNMAAQTAAGTSGYPVVPGTAYTAFASLLTAASPRNVQVGIVWYTSSGAQIGYAYGPAYADNTAGWERAQYTAVAPSNAAFAAVTVQVVATGAAAEVHYVDCVMLSAKTVPGQRYYGDTNTETQWAGINPNLIDNGDFEQDISGWSVLGGPATTLARSTAEAYTGLASMLITWGAAGPTASATSMNVNVAAGVTYTLSGWVYVPAGNPAVVWYAGPAGGPFVTGAASTVTGSWQRITVTFTPGQSGVWTMQLNNAVAATAGQVCYVDAVKLEVGSTATQFVPETYSNLVTNPSFEDGTVGGWSGSGGSTVANSTALALYGSHSLAITVAAASVTTNIASNLLPVVANTTYTVSGWVYSTVAQTLAIGLDDNISGGFVGTSVVVQANTWTRLTAAGQVANSTNTGAIFLQSPSPVAGICYLDGLQLELGHQANPYVDGSMIGGSWDSSDNLLSAEDASFEGGTVGDWVENGTGVTVANSTAEAFSGTHSLLVTMSTAGGAGSGFGAHTTQLPIAPSTTYTFSAWMMGAAGTTDLAYVQVLWYDSTGTLIAGTALTGTQHALTTGFQRYVVTGTSPSNAAYFILKALTYSNNAGDSFYVDAVQVEQREYATAYDSTGAANGSSSTYSYPWDIVGDTHYLDEVGLFPGDTLGYRLEVLADQPVAYWPLDDPAGSTTANNVVQSGNGTVNGTVTFGQAGPVASDPSQTAALFDGSTGFISTPNALGGGVGPLTLETWVKAPSATAWDASNMAFLSNRDNGGNIAFAQSNNGVLELWINGEPGPLELSGGSIGDGKWHHVAAVITANSTTIYVDGVQVASGSGMLVPMTAAAFQIANDSNGKLNGTVAQVALYDTALSAARIQAHYDAGIATTGSIVQRWTRGGLVGNTTTTIERSDNQYVRGAGWPTGTTTAIPAGNQTVTVTDTELTPGATYTYTAAAAANLDTVTINSPSATSNNVTITTTDWWFFVPSAPSGAVTAAVTNFQPSQTEFSAAHKPIGATALTIVADTVGATDGTLTVRTSNAATYTAVKALTASQTTVAISDPFGDLYYGRLGILPGGMSGGAGNKTRAGTLNPSTAANPVRDLTLTFVAQPRP